MAPEQMAGGKIDHRTDLCSVGMILYEMLTGQMALGRFGLPGEIYNGMPKELDDTLKKALDHNPMRRFKDAASMRRSLVKAVSASPDTIKAMPPTEKEAIIGFMMAGMGASLFLRSFRPPVSWVRGLSVLFGGAWATILTMQSTWWPWDRTVAPDTQIFVLCLSIALLWFGFSGKSKAVRAGTGKVEGETHDIETGEVGRKLRRRVVAFAVGVILLVAVSAFFFAP
jgi:hypothetical protein